MPHWQCAIGAWGHPEADPKVPEADPKGPPASRYPPAVADAGWMRREKALEKLGGFSEKWST